MEPLPRPKESVSDLDAPGSACNRARFRTEVERLAQLWRQDGLPPRRQLREDLTRLRDRRRELAVPGLWAVSPLMITATLDDGWGHGMETVAACADALGISVHPLGLLVKPQVVAAACWELRPAYLALTVLHMESEDNLAAIARQLPQATRLLVGGALVHNRPQAASELGFLAARNLLDFIEFCLHP